MQNSTPSSIPERIRRVAPQAAAGLVFLAMLAVSWRRWTSPIADSGREMDLPWRLLQGERLYRDVHYLYPPLSPYLNALLYRIFGVHWDVLLGAGVVCAVLIAALCYRLARRLLSPAEASLATSAVIVLCLFKPAGNLISPYSFSALHGMALALAVVWQTMRYVERREARPRAARLALACAGAGIGLAAAAKQEFALAGALTVAAAVAYAHRERWGAALRDLLWAALPAAAIALPLYGGLLWAVGWRTLIEDCHLFYTNLPASLVFYNSHRTGMDRPWFSLLQMLGASILMIAVARTIAMLSDAMRRHRPAAYLETGVCLLLVVAIRGVSGGQWDGSPLRALPLLLLIVLFQEWRRGGCDARRPQLFVLAAYSLAVLARVALRVPSGGAFGGFFLPTSVILLCYLLLRALPAGIATVTPDGDAPRRARGLVLGLLLALLAATMIVFGVRYRRNFDFELVAPRGHLFLPRASGEAIRDALAFLESETAPGEAVAVLPEGSDLAFLIGRRMPLRHQILIPGLMRPEDEAAAIDTLQRQNVRYVLLVNRPMREFGAERFGEDFYPRLGGWIDSHYRQVRVFGLPPEPVPRIGAPKFFIRVLARMP